MKKSVSIYIDIKSENDVYKAVVLEITEFTDGIFNDGITYRKSFDSGDFVKDWWRALKYRIDRTKDTVTDAFGVTSQLNHLEEIGVNVVSTWMDKKDNGEPVLYYPDRTDPLWFESNVVRKYFELFVPDTSWTWEQLKEHGNS